MLRRIFFIAIISALMPILAFAAIPGKGPKVLEKPQRPVRVSLGQHKSVNASGYDLQINHIQMDGASFLGIRCRQNQVFFGLEKSAPKVSLEASSGFIFINGKPYRNVVTILPKEDECLVINTLDLEKYLAGLINKEMLPSWPIEALKAQAVAARSYAVYQMRHRAQEEYDLESSTQDQVYEGASSETPKSNQAVESTRGIVLAWKQEEIKAFYHSNCGGRTESPKDVWGVEYGYISSVTCPFHQKGDRKTWQAKINFKDLEHRLRKVVGLLPKDFLGIANVFAGEKNLNNRVGAILVADNSGRSVKIPANAFRNAMGTTKVKSTAFSLQQNHDHSIQLSGEGYGHGVGMCQTGAKVLAQRGSNYKAILSYYYPLAKLSRL